MTWILFGYLTDGRRQLHQEQGSRCGTTWIASIFVATSPICQKSGWVCRVSCHPSHCIRQRWWRHLQHHAWLSAHQSLEVLDQAPSRQKFQPHTSPGRADQQRWELWIGAWNHHQPPVFFLFLQCWNWSGPSCHKNVSNVQKSGLGLKTIILCYSPL